MRRYRSRLAEVEEKKSIKSAVIFGGATILIIILAIVFGIPAFSRFVGLVSKKSNTDITSTSAPTLLPPVLNPLPDFTNQQSIVVKGSATPNSTVKIFFNDSSDEGTTDGNGNFAMTVSLTKGINTIYAEVVDNNGNKSDNSNEFSVTFTNKEPSLTINLPANNQNFYGSTQKTLDVQGQTDANNSVTINDHVAVLDNSGKFSFNIDLSNGDNQIKVIAIDQAGNKKEIDLKVTFNP